LRRAPGRELGVGITTAFNLIHVSCHRDAVRAEKGGKTARSEWDGAALRNQQTPCNNLLPLWGGTVPRSAYANAVDRFWSMSSNVARLPESRGRPLVHVLGGLLRCCATGLAVPPGPQAPLASPLPFLEDSVAITSPTKSASSSGGSRQCNARLVPGVMQVTLRSLRSSTASPDSALVHAAATGGAVDEGALFSVAASLLLHANEEAKWRSTLFAAMSAMLKVAGAAARAAGREATAEWLWEAIRPGLLTLALADGIRSATVAAAPSRGPESDDKDAEDSQDPMGAVEWRLRVDDMACVEGCARAIETLDEEAAQAASFMEIFDILEILEPVLQHAPSCEEFVTRTAGPEQEVDSSISLAQA